MAYISLCNKWSCDGDDLLCSSLPLSQAQSISQAHRQSQLSCDTSNDSSPEADAPMLADVPPLLLQYPTPHSPMSWKLLWLYSQKGAQKLTALARKPKATNTNAKSTTHEAMMSEEQDAALLRSTTIRQKTRQNKTSLRS